MSERQKAKGKEQEAKSKRQEAIGILEYLRVTICSCDLFSFFSRPLPFALCLLLFAFASWFLAFFPHLCPRFHEAS